MKKKTVVVLCSSAFRSYQLASGDCCKYADMHIVWAPESVLTVKHVIFCLHTCTTSHTNFSSYEKKHTRNMRPGGECKN